MIKLKNGRVLEEGIRITEEFAQAIIENGISEYRCSSNVKDEIGLIYMFGLEVFKLLTTHQVFTPKEELDEVELMNKINEVFWKINNELLK